MANICEFEMMVVPRREDADVHEFLLNISEMGRGCFIDSVIDSDLYTGGAWVCGGCKWSANSSLLASEFTGDPIDEWCKKCGVEVEIYTIETGMGFAEHYVITSEGVIVVDDCVSYSEDWEEDEDGQYVIVSTNGGYNYTENGYEWTLPVD